MELVLEGTSFVDTSALTGESVPREVTSGNEILSGSINNNGVLKVKVDKGIWRINSCKNIRISRKCI